MRSSGDGLFYSFRTLCHPTTFWSPLLLMKSRLLILLGSPNTMRHFSLAALLSVFQQLLLWCAWVWTSLCLSYLEFMASWMCRWFIIKFGIFSHYFFCSFLSILSSPSGTYLYYVYGGVLNGIPYFSEALFIFFIPIPSFELHNLYVSMFKFTDSIFC